jgi:predicted nucleotide-binding protein
LALRLIAAKSRYRDALHRYGDLRFQDARAFSLPAKMPSYGVSEIVPMTPRVFIGSSKQRGLKLARTIQNQLSDDAIVQVWDQDFYAPGEGALETLLRRLPEFQFGIFVFSPDDYSDMNGEQVLVARDNVVFEAGLFFSRLGRKRTLIVAPYVTGGGPAFHMPSDLAGLTVIHYGYPLPQNNSDLAPHLATPCNKIRNVFRNEQMTLAVPAISGGPVFLLRHLEQGTISSRDAAEILRSFNNSSGCTDVWARGAKYACMLLMALNFAEDVGHDSYRITNAGRAILPTFAAQFKNVAKRPLISVGR